jgi:hypothetical protein
MHITPLIRSNVGNNDFMMDQKARNIQSILDQDSQLGKKYICFYQ